jgi:tetratricopeptide (TPR) repeat protein
LLLELGSLHYQNKQYDKAINVYRAALSSTTNNRYKYLLLKNLALVYIAQGEKSQALESLNEIMSIFPYNIQYHFEVAHYKEMAGGYNEAIQIYESIINSTDNDSDINNARLEIARNYFYKGDYDKASQLANELINLGNSEIAFNAKMILLTIEREK